MAPMTEPSTAAPATGEPTDATRLIAAVLAAHADVARVRRELEAGLATGDSVAVQDALASHWRRHGTTHAVVARLLGEEVRGAVLVQLRGWQRQLAAQLDALAALRAQTRT